MTNSLRTWLASLCLFAFPVANGATPDTPRQLEGFPEKSLTITHAGGRDSFRVWIADTPQRQQQGLMFVREMASDRGMLFPQREARVMSMWMKNTFLSLDMVWIGTDGNVTGVAANTKPQSETIIESPGPITAVLELNAGEAAKRGIKVGSKVTVSP